MDYRANARLWSTRPTYRMAPIGDGRHFGGVDLALRHGGKSIQLGLQLRRQRLGVTSLHVFHQQVLWRLQLSAEAAVTTTAHPGAGPRHSWYTISLPSRSSHRSRVPHRQPLLPRGGSDALQPAEAGRQALVLAPSDQRPGAPAGRPEHHGEPVHGESSPGYARKSEI